MHFLDHRCPAGDRRFVEQGGSPSAVFDVVGSKSRLRLFGVHDVCHRVGVCRMPSSTNLKLDVRLVESSLLAPCPSTSTYKMAISCFHMRNKKSRDKKKSRRNENARKKHGTETNKKTRKKYEEKKNLKTHETLFKISWIHVGTTCHQRGMPGSSRLLHHCFHQCLVPRRPSFRMPTTHGKDPHASCDMHPRLGNPSIHFQGTSFRAPSSLSMTVPRSHSIATETTADVCLRSSLLAFSWVILAASGANLHTCSVSLLKLLLHLLLRHSVFNPEGDVKGTFVPSHILLLGAPRRTIQ